MSKKVLIFMSSPRKESNTAELCKKFAEGASAAGHEVVQFNAFDLKISPCLACNYCGEHRGCCQPDDMRKIYDAFNDCDVIVLASPLYYYTINAQMKIFIDRLYALGLPNGFKYSQKESFLIMTAGENREDLFDPPLRYYNLLLDKMFPWKSRGELCIGGFSANPSIEGHPALDKAYQLGKSL